MTSAVREPPESSCTTPSPTPAIPCISTAKISKSWPKVGVNGTAPLPPRPTHPVVTHRSCKWRRPTARGPTLSSSSSRTTPVSGRCIAISRGTFPPVCTSTWLSALPISRNSRSRPAFLRLVRTGLRLRRRTSQIKSTLVFKRIASGFGRHVGRYV